MVGSRFKAFLFDELDSTNDTAKDYEVGSVIIAKIQKKGKGRKGNTWLSDKAGLWFSVVLDYDDSAKITIIAGLAVSDAIDSLYGLGSKIKWPNDIIIDDKKVCGILAEKIDDKIILGIGINTNNIIDDKIKDIAVSLKEKLSRNIDNDLLLDKVLDYIDSYSKLDNIELLKRFNQKNYLENKDIKITQSDKTYIGSFKRLDNDFAFIIDSEGKEIRIVDGVIVVF